MKRTAYILGFAVLALLLGSALTRVFGGWYVPRYTHGHDDEMQLFGVFLVIWPLFFIVGGFFGNWLYRRNLTRRSTGRAKAARR